MNLFLSYISRHNMDIVSFLEGIDVGILTFANGHHSHVFDILMWWISDRYVWLPLYLLFAVIFVRKLGWSRGLVVIICVGLMITLTDQTCATYIRPAVARMRPSNPDNPISVCINIVNDYRGGAYGFPSCHAANTFAFAVYTSLIIKRRCIAIGLISWSLLVSYSRLYLGVHYPSDLLGGMVIGGAYAGTFYILLKKLKMVD